MRRYYLAYGSNLNMSQMARRCPDATVAGIGTIEDYRLLFRGSGSGAYLTIEPCPGASVPVGIWEVTKADERRLDAYEGYPVFYYKKQMKLTMSEPDGEREIEAFVYIMNNDRPIGLPTDYYVRTCADGYADFGFDTHFLEKAIRSSIKEGKSK